ncbi:MAG: RagB/SusD family nutrient uptake outer membrane protein [Bacteroidetes bacterium]|nr:RagB/SusD family nutrient uptake outer membrane protein [Bacteroidota bacterium]
MKRNKLFKIAAVFGVIATMTGCTKLNEQLSSTLTNGQTANALGSNGVALLLQNAYTDLGGPFTAQDLVFSLQENATDESLVPTRGGDWDDNGVWRVVHAHTWTADHSQVLNVFNALNKINFDATNVLGFSPTASQAAQARFIRAFALYTLLDLYGQYPIRNPGDNLLNAPTVKSGADAVNFIASELTAAIPNLPTTGASSVATKDAANVLLMKLLLNKGMFLNRTNPTFADADMQQVITIGNSIISSGKYTLMPSYFDNFSATNSGSTESIFAYPNTSGVSANNSGPQGRWCMTLHYNQETDYVPNAGWNGFSTIGDFYSSFGAVTPTTGVANWASIGAINNPDTILDKRLGGRYYQGCTNISGIRPGLMIGQQYDQNGVALKDRKGAPLAFNPTIAANMQEQGANLEVTGIRVPKYVPDFTNGTKYYQGPSGNWIQLFRYPDVILMVAEAKLRAASPDAAGALTLVNTLRAARGAGAMAGPLTLLDNGTYANISSTVDNPKCLLAERGREFYWEGQRRTDLLRFGVFNKLWQYKTADDAHYNVYPIPTQALASNPNLVQNPGY